MPCSRRELLAHRRLSVELRSLPPVLAEAAHPTTHQRLSMQRRRFRRTIQRGSLPPSPSCCGRQRAAGISTTCCPSRHRDEHSAGRRAVLRLAVRSVLAHARRLCARRRHPQGWIGIDRIARLLANSLNESVVQANGRRVHASMRRLPLSTIVIDLDRHALRACELSDNPKDVIDAAIRSAFTSYPKEDDPDWRSPHWINARRVRAFGAGLSVQELQAQRI